MNDNEIFNLPKDADFASITEAYAALKKKLSEERFAEGEAGNEASRRLMDLEQAYAEASLRHKKEKAALDFGSGLSEADDLIQRGRLEEAQAVLDAVNERGGEWHYLQSIIFYKRGWYAECKKQLSFALQAEPANPKFISARERLESFLNSAKTPPPGGAFAGGYYGAPAARPQNNQALDMCCLEACCCLQCLYCCR